VTVAALYVERGGVYYGLPDVDPWDEARDARLYAGPHPVVAHPPCGAWGVFARQGWTTRSLGDDDGCFAAALRAVRNHGGVLEHPACSSAWKAHGLLQPPMGGGWLWSGDGQGWTCTVEQGHYGHQSRKPSWLYVVCGALPPPELKWGQAITEGNYNNIATTKRRRTPPAFRDLLLSIARSAYAYVRGA
jgi:hypothetical protein